MIINTGGIPTPEKPEFGQPCNYCGLCCEQGRCHLAVDVIGEGPGPCPLMIMQDGEFLCSLVLVENIAGQEPLFAASLGIGTFCDSTISPDSI